MTIDTILNALATSSITRKDTFMKVNSLLIRFVGSIVALCLFGSAEASRPVWTFTPLTETSVSVPGNQTTSVQYRVTS